MRKKRVKKHHHNPSEEVDIKLQLVTPETLPSLENTLVLLVTKKAIDSPMFYHPASLCWPIVVAHIERVVDGSAGVVQAWFLLPKELADDDDSDDSYEDCNTPSYIREYHHVAKTWVYTTDDLCKERFERYFVRIEEPYDACPLPTKLAAARRMLANLPQHMPALRRLMANPQLHYRLTGDRNVQYGDGGRNDLEYPIYMCRELAVAPDSRTRLVALLHALNAERGDFQENTPVEDIIDPDLFPKRLFDPEKLSSNPSQHPYIQRRYAAINKRHVSSILDSYITAEEEEQEEGEQSLPAPYDSNGTGLSRFKRAMRRGIRVPAGITLRESYRWIPATFVVRRADHSVEIATPINNLPQTAKNQPLYAGLADVFSKMVPMFDELGLIDPQQSTTSLQVIVKAQSYNLKPRMSYSGRWHVEGHTENIAAVGVYYAHVDPAIEGGALKFRQAESPAPVYVPNNSVEAPIREGAAVVFANRLPHRFRKMLNTSAEANARRTFVNFFVVDPKRPIDDCSDVTAATADVIGKVLRAYALRRLNVWLPHVPVIHEILSFLGAWPSERAAKRFRSEARKAMLAERSGWGWINWGNCGEVMFVPHASMGAMSGYNAPFDDITHTDSA